MLKSIISKIPVKYLVMGAFVAIIGLAILALMIKKVVILILIAAIIIAIIIVIMKIINRKPSGGTKSG